MKLQNTGSVLCFLMSCVFFASNASANAEDQTTKDWTNFRKQYPFHIQTIALSAPSTNGGQTLIVSEPPPTATLDGIKSAAPTLMAGAVIMQHSIGVDGWVKDVVVAIPPKAPALSREITSLSSYLFGTSYKAYALQLPLSKRPHDKLNLDVQIGAHELQAWLEEKSTFRTLGDPASFSLSQICQTERTQVYYSADPGLVLWWVPTGTTLSDHRAIIRQFALDSDLLVGGMIKDKGVIVIARERTTPLEIVQPMRTEAILMLANIEEKELKQSYERNYPLAGRFDGESDWAPILLSPELRHTEFGSLLNITDQLLKGWTMAGTIKYRNFPYPVPPSFPFHNPDKPKDYRPLYHLLSEQIQREHGGGVGSLTFNWNTVGAGYSLEYLDGTIYAVNRTGALPVTYIPDDTEDDGSPEGKLVHDAMETGYAYFATLDDPNLARVFQYTSFYQLFRAARLAGKWKTTDRVTSHPQPESELRKLFINALTQVRDEPDQFIGKLAKRTPQPSSQDISEMAKPIVQTWENGKRDASKYSVEALTEGLTSLETVDSINELLTNAEIYEEDFAAHSANELPPLPDNASEAQLNQRAIARCLELIGRDDSYWKQLEIAVRNEAGSSAKFADYVTDELNQFRADLKALGSEQIKKYASQATGGSESAKQKDWLDLRSSLASCKRLRERATDDSKSKQDGLDMLDWLLGQVKLPTTDELVGTFKWLDEATKEEFDKIASDAARSILMEQSKEQQEVAKEVAALLRKQPSGAIELCVSLLDRSQSEAERDATIQKLTELVDGEDAIGELYSLVTGSGELLASAQVGDFVSIYPKAVERQSSLWIKTPSIVISKATGESLGVTGGHNVDTRITKFEISTDPAVKPGKVQLTSRNGADVILVSGDDAAKIPSQVRLTGARFKTIEELERRANGDPLVAEKVRKLREQAVSELQTAIEGAKLPPARTQLAALKMPEARSPLNRGAIPPEVAGVDTPAFWRHGSWSDFRSAPEKVRTLDAQLREAGTSSIVVSRRADGSIDMISPPAKYLRAGNPQSAIDFCAGEIVETANANGSLVRIQLEGFTPDENKAILSSIRIRTASNVEGQYGMRLKEGKTLRNFHESLVKDFDFKGATLKIETGEFGIKGVADIPLLGDKGKGQMTILVRIKGATKAALKKLGDAIAKVFETFKLKGVNRDAISQLRKDVRDTAKQMGLDASDLEIQFQSEMGDFYIAEVPAEAPPTAALARR